MHESHGSRIVSSKKFSLNRFVETWLEEVYSHNISEYFLKMVSKKLLFITWILQFYHLTFIGGKWGCSDMGCKKMSEKKKKASPSSANELSPYSSEIHKQASVGLSAFVRSYHCCIILTSRIGNELKQKTSNLSIHKSQPKLFKAGWF